jgi:hypothetical protein
LKRKELKPVEQNIPIPPATPSRRSLSLAILAVGLTGGFHAPATTAAETLPNPPESTPNPGIFLALDPAQFRHYVDSFNREIPGRTAHFIPDTSSWEWIKDNIPFLEVPDKDLERTYYYRWWSFRKHIKQTPQGFVITEFIRNVSHSARYNAISCATGHHIDEGRWLQTQDYLDDYIRFWLQGGRHGGLLDGFHQYSGWMADSVYRRCLVTGQRQFAVELLEPLITDYQTWVKQRQLPNGLFWQFDVRDGMEESVSGSRHAKNARPTINSYMYGNAKAIAQIAQWAGNPKVAGEYRARADRLKRLVQTQLWDRKDQFFKPLLEETGRLAGVRELIGLTPWYFNLPDEEEGYEIAWKQLMDPQGFYAPYGPTTAEQRHPGFRLSYTGDACQWNGPSWPFSTSITLRALANLLNHSDQRVVTRADYFNVLQIYTRSHRRRLPDGSVIPWIDENLHPYTGQ